MKKMMITLIISILCVVNLYSQQLAVGIINATPKLDTVTFLVFAGTGALPTTAITRRFEHGVANILDSSFTYLGGSWNAVDTFLVNYPVSSTDTFDYTVCVVNSGGWTGCSDQVSVATLSTTGTGVIFNPVLPFQIAIAPNPTKYQSKITFPYYFVGRSCSVFNSMGQIARSFTVEESVTFFKEDLPSGIYFLNVSGLTKKLFIE